MEILYRATADSVTHPTKMVLTTCTHTLYCARRRHLPFFVFPIFILSHPAWDRIKSSRYYTEMCLCLPDMFSLSGPTVITFPGFQTSTHETANLPRECADLPSLMFFCFKTFMRLIHSYVLISQNNTKLQTRSSRECFTTKLLGVQFEKSCRNLCGCNEQKCYLNSLLNPLTPN